MGSSLSAVSASPASFTPPSQLRRQLAQQQQQQQVQQRATENRIEMNEHVEAKVYKVNDTCSLCLETFTPADNVVHLIKCHNHFFHKDCGLHMTIEEYVAKHNKCPYCMQIYGVMRGKMKITRLAESLNGYENCGTIRILFTFPAGVQTEEHYHPGVPYTSDARYAYLPDNDRGNTILEMFKLAYSRKILFTIGRSVTRMVDDVVIYNGIHMKTTKTGAFGYPDPTYFFRVEEELRGKGITAREDTQPARHPTPRNLNVSNDGEGLL